MVANIGLPADGEDNRGWQLWIVSTVMVIVSGLFVLIRLAARHFRNGIQVDDWTILAAAVRLFDRTSINDGLADGIDHLGCTLHHGEHG